MDLIHCQHLNERVNTFYTLMISYVNYVLHNKSNGMSLDKAHKSLFSVHWISNIHTTPHHAVVHGFSMCYNMRHYSNKNYKCKQINLGTLN